MATEIVKHEGGRAAAMAVPIRGVEDLLYVGRVLAASNFFKNTIDENQAAAKILAGMELGIAAVASLRGLYIVEGQITLAYPMIGALIKRSGKYDYRIRALTADECSVEFFENGESVGFSALTMKQAKERGLDKTKGGYAKEPWVKFPENMLLSKCLSNGAKAYTSEVFFGAVYTPDELGAEVDGATGAMVSIEEVPGVTFTACEAEGCGNLIADHTTEQGKTMSAAKIEEGTRAKYGKALCWDCAQKAKKAAETEEANNAKPPLEIVKHSGARANQEKAREVKAVVAHHTTGEAPAPDATTSARQSKQAQALVDARHRYQEACNAARTLNIKPPVPIGSTLTLKQLAAATGELVGTIQDAISAVAMEQQDIPTSAFPKDDDTLAEWMTFVAAWDLQSLIAAEVGEEEGLDMEEEMSEEELADLIPN